MSPASYFSHSCDQIPGENQTEVGRVHIRSQCEGLWQIIAFCHMEAGEGEADQIACLVRKERIYRKLPRL